ncbi:bifunctional folylpolyglutamate synthase/dihydrofolate synthase [bacterium]|nr:bifunctional folylpolyglutamate synthase/dihydrofolate synthase [bacterium]
MLQHFLDNKPLYYDEIDYTRMPRVYEKIKSHIRLPEIIHIIGTNGKGTTGRFLASALHAKGFNTGHYTSPHILRFNERIWLNGENASDEMLDAIHKELQALLSDEDASALSYFEYTTFLAMMLYRECDYVVLEAGLGGEYDATAVFAKLLTLVTPIDIDHEAFLGTDIKQIATTKLNAMQKNMILGYQKYEDVYEIACEIARDKDAKVSKVSELLTEDDLKNIQEISQDLKLVPYLQENLMLSISALKFLELQYSPADFKDAKLFGRLSAIGENILLDVGHNPLAAKSILKALEGTKYTLVYNSYKDKNYKEILAILKPIIQSVEIIDVYDARIESKALLQRTLKDLKIEYSAFEKVNPHARYLVFGSFSVAEAFLKALDE